MSTIILDVTRLVTRLCRRMLPTGIDRVSLAYVDRYGARARAALSARGATVILRPEQSQQVFAWIRTQDHARSTIGRLVTQACLAHVKAESLPNGVLLHTSHFGLEFPHYYRTLRARRIKLVAMVHDMIPVTHGEYCRPGVGARHRKRVHTAIQYADGLLANSQATLDSLSMEARSANLTLPHAAVARLASSITDRGYRERLLDTPYFVMLGTIEPRKNHWLILHVWQRLVESLGASAPKLIIIGRRGWECENIVDMLERCDNLRGMVIEEGNCSDERLLAYIQHAQALLFPSFVEGYGLPLAEALALRVPVLASDLPVFREVAADIPDYLDPLDGPAWLHRIEAYMHAASPQRRAQLARIGRFHHPTWGDHFESVDRLLDVL